MLPSEYIQKGWCKGEVARDEDGGRSDYADIDAVSWCCIGALLAAADEGAITNRQSDTMERYIENQLIEGIADWNDAQESAEPIIAMLQEAEKSIGLNP